MGRFYQQSFSVRAIHEYKVRHLTGNSQLTWRAEYHCTSSPNAAAEQSTAHWKRKKRQICLAGQQNVHWNIDLVHPCGKENFPGETCREHWLSHGIFILIKSGCNFFN